MEQYPDYFHCSVNSVQSLSRVRLFATPWIAARQASLSITNSRSSLRLMSIESVMPSSHHPLLLLSPVPPLISHNNNLCYRYQYVIPITICYPLTITSIVSWFQCNSQTGGLPFLYFYSASNIVSRVALNHLFHLIPLLKTLQSNMKNRKHILH